MNYLLLSLVYGDGILWPFKQGAIRYFVCFMFAVQIFLVITESSICAGRRDMAVKAFPKDDGYRGIWFTLGQFSEYGDKYSGGLGMEV